MSGRPTYPSHIHAIALDIQTPWELAKAAVFLALDESRFVVGAELRVDHGVGNLYGGLAGLTGQPRVR